MFRIAFVTYESLIPLESFLSVIIIFLDQMFWMRGEHARQYLPKWLCTNFRPILAIYIRLIFNEKYCCRGNLFFFGWKFIFILIKTAFLRPKLCSNLLRWTTIVLSVLFFEISIFCSYKLLFQFRYVSPMDFLGDF